MLTLLSFCTFQQQSQNFDHLCTLLQFPRPQDALQAWSYITSHSSDLFGRFQLNTMSMIGMNTRMIDSPPGIIYHTPVKELFKPYPGEKLWYKGEQFPGTGELIDRETGEFDIIDKIVGMSTSTFLNYLRTAPVHSHKRNLIISCPHAHFF